MASGKQREPREPKIVDINEIKENAKKSTKDKSKLPDDEKQLIESKIISFAHILNQLMYFKKISAQNLSKETGISEGSISKYKNGEGLPNTLELLRLAKRFKVSLSYLLGETTDTRGRAEIMAVEKRLGLSAKVQETLEKMTINSKRNEDYRQRSFYADMIKLINWLILTTDYDNDIRKHQEYNPILSLILFYFTLNTDKQYDLFITGELKDYETINQVGYSPNALLLNEDLMGDAVLTHLTRAIVEMKKLHYSNKSNLVIATRSKKGGNVNVKEKK